MKKHIAVGLILLSCLGLIYFVDMFLIPGDSIADIGWKWYLNSEWYKMDSWLMTDIAYWVIAIPFIATFAMLAILYRRCWSRVSNKRSLWDKILCAMFWLYVLAIAMMLICSIKQDYRNGIDAKYW